MPSDGKTKIPAVPLRTPMLQSRASVTKIDGSQTPASGSTTDDAQLTRPWVIFFEQLIGALGGIGGNVTNIINNLGTWTEETPAGALDGSNKVYTILETPIAGTLALYLNGVEQVEGIDYTISGTTITMTVALKARDVGRWRAKYAH